MPHVMQRAQRATAPVVKVKITRNMIQTATLRNSNKCMIADGIRLARPDARFIRVTAQCIAFSDHEAGLRYKFFTPQRAIKALLKFDEGDKDIKPFRVRLVDGNVYKAGWKANHPNSDRRGKRYRKTGITRPRGPQKREFGMCLLAKPKGTAAA